MADCDRFYMMMSQHIDGELTDEEQAELLEHLRGCEDCRRMFMAMKAVSDNAAGLAVEPPEGLAAGIMYKLERGAGKKRSVFSRFAFGRYTAVAAVLVIVILGVSNGWFDGLAGKKSVDSAETDNVELGIAYTMMAAPNSAPEPLPDSAEPADGENFLDTDAAKNELEGAFGGGANAPEDSNGDAPSASKGIASGADASDTGAPGSELAALPGANRSESAEALPVELAFAESMDVMELDYDRSFFAVILIEGELPGDCAEYERLLDEETEIRVVIPADVLIELVEQGEADTVYSGDLVSAEGLLIAYPVGW